MRLESRSLLLFAVVAALVAGPAAAQDEGLSRTEMEYLARAGSEPSIVPTGPDVPGSPDWGIADVILYVVPASACTETENQEYVSAFGWYGGNGTGSYRIWDCPLMLPSGSLIYRMLLTVNDSDTTDYLAFYLREYAILSTNYTTEGSGASSVSGNPGYTFVGPAYPNLTIDNYNKRYAARVRAGATTLTLWKRILLGVKLQVSPAPASATFLDVPTGHWAFQFVEALVSSGITAGCGGGNYCPDANVTRAEMAVFLAGGLGLHWPN